MPQHTGSLIFYFYSHKNSLNLLGEKCLDESHWPMRRIRLLECNNNNVCMYSFISSAYTKIYIYKTTSKYKQHRFKHKSEC